MNFNDRTDFRLREEESKLITKVILLNNEKYNSASHFIRCAVKRLLDEELKKSGV